MSEDFRRFVKRVCDELRVIGDRAVAIRKILSAAQKKNSNDRGVMSDAVQLAQTIESYCSFGQNCTAEDAFEIAEKVEILISLLESEFDAI